MKRKKRMPGVPHLGFYQYPRGELRGGILNTTICPTITTCSWSCNCFLIEEYE